MKFNDLMEECYEFSTKLSKYASPTICSFFSGLANPEKADRRFFAHGLSEKSISGSCKVRFTRFCNKQERNLGRKLRNVEGIFFVTCKVYRTLEALHIIYLSIE